jgi:hypothetical protein
VEVRGGIDPDWWRKKHLLVVDWTESELHLPLYRTKRLSILQSYDEKNWHDDVLVDVAEQLRNPTVGQLLSCMTRNG